MRSIMSGLVVLVMAFALVSSANAGCWSFCNDNPAVSADPVGFKDADRPSQSLPGAPYPCIASPAYPDYTNARAIACPANEEATRVPMFMGSPGL